MIDKDKKILWQRIAKNGSTKLLHFWISLFLDIKFSQSMSKYDNKHYSKNPRDFLRQAAIDTKHTLSPPKFKHYQQIMTEEDDFALDTADLSFSYNHSYNYSYRNYNGYSYKNVEQWIKIIVLRDPLTRLVSGYMDKCVPFVTKACKFVLDILGKPYTLRSTVMFDEVVDAMYEKLVINPNDHKKTIINEHFQAQTMFGYIFYLIEKFEYIIILDKETFGINIFQLLFELKKKNRLKHDDVNFYWQQHGRPVFDVELNKSGALVMNKYKSKYQFTGHSTSKSSEKEFKLFRTMFENKQTLEKALEIFKYDYLLLPFEYPPRYLSTQY